MSMLDSMRLASRADQEHKPLHRSMLDSMRLASRTDQEHKSLHRSDT